MSNHAQQPVRRVGADTVASRLVCAEPDGEQHAGPLNYTVLEGSQLTVNIDSPTSTVVVGGSQSDSFMNDPVRVAQPLTCMESMYNA